MYGNNGSGYGGSTWTNNGRRNGAYLFDGINDYISTINNVPLTKQATVSFWTIHPNVTAYASKVLIELSTNFNSNDAFVVAFNDNTAGVTPPTM